ncbi:CRISPR-associated protein Cas4 [Saccharopolyspora phatthalungensis]|uniref:CRISPR-associated exonuclease Cas4 n=1 Tax=Saccharopolyspora phatthalungensis TaxID=664693 RepID=A0A840Q7V1_9PSEU|nr:CRISPR-associated protein Cas4 [Saccharopolyspora phatthalungensis]MBB5156526.1 CRISPR-associated exonuclease Cas4 [Saccharopolyspora phatthalungensis]
MDEGADEAAWTSIPVSAIEHFAYCPRQAALIHLDRYFADNTDTQRGHFAHEVVDSGGPSVSRTGIPTWSSLEISDSELGVHGVCDVVEFHQGEPVPVEHKSGSYRPGSAADLQVAAQVLCLRRMFSAAVPHGVIFAGRHRRRYEVVVDDALEQRLRAVLARLRQVFRTGALPAPVNDARCDRCSLREGCMPSVLVDASALFVPQPLGRWDD